MKTRIKDSTEIPIFFVLSVLVGRFTNEKSIDEEMREIWQFVTQIGVDILQVFVS